MFVADQLIRKLGKLYEGCFADNIPARDLPFHVSHDPSHMTAATCMTNCRQQAFLFAGVQVRIVFMF